MKCEACGQDVQSQITHICNPIVKDMFQNPWKYTHTDNQTSSKFKCLKCGEILLGHDQVSNHKQNNWDHFEYSLVGTNMKLGFA